MGLDFELYKKKKGLNLNQFYHSFDNMSYDDFEKEYSLAYGRKSWELVEELATKDEVENCYGILTKDKWNNLMSKLEPIGDLLDKIYDAYDHEEYEPDNYSEFIFTDEDKSLIAQYEYWYNKTFDCSPYLGYSFSVGYMKSFWKAKDEVNKVLDDPDYEVVMSISY